MAKSKHALTKADIARLGPDAQRQIREQLGLEQRPQVRRRQGIAQAKKPVRLTYIMAMTPFVLSIIYVLLQQL